MPVHTRSAAIAPHIADRERELQEREKRIADRERDVAEQRRVLAEQQRILRAAVAAAPSPTTGGPEGRPYAAGAPSASEAVPHPPVAPHWPPRREPAAQRYRYVVQRRETRSFWRRLRDTLFGIEPVLEDSL
jgi:hypothetical protein